MKKYGFEREYWVLPVSTAGLAGQPILTPIELPGDECGYLAEARGTPDSSPLIAAYLLLAEEERLRQLVAGRFLLTTTAPTRRLDPKLRHEALRRFGKNAITSDRGSLYGKSYSPTDRWSRAGLHVHFSDYSTYYDPACKKCGRPPLPREIPNQQDLPRIIRYLDGFFATEIRRAQRLPGLYELKLHGFEYRSLPADVDVVRVASAIKAMETQ